jgi:hypothetical protein
LATNPATRIDRRAATGLPRPARRFPQTEDFSTIPSLGSACLRSFSKYPINEDNQRKVLTGSKRQASTLFNRRKLNNRLEDMISTALYFIDAIRERNLLSIVFHPKPDAKKQNPESDLRPRPRISGRHPQRPLAMVSLA